MLQFLIEALSLSLTGGALGIGLGLVTSHLLDAKWAARARQPGQHRPGRRGVMRDWRLLRTLSRDEGGAIGSDRGAASGVVMNQVVRFFVVARLLLWTLWVINRERQQVLGRGRTETPKRDRISPY